MDSSALPKPEQPTASTNAAAIADLLGNPTAQQQPVGKSSRRGWVWLLVLLPLVVTGVFLSPRLLEFLPETNQTADLTGMPLYTVQRRDLQITVTEEGSLVSDENVDKALTEKKAEAPKEEKKVEAPKKEKKVEAPKKEKEQLEKKDPKEKK